MKKPRHVPSPTKQQVLDFIKGAEGRVGKRELARAFNLKGDEKIQIKAILKQLENEGAVERGHKRRFARPGAIPDMLVVEITGTDTDGELIAKPLTWSEEGRPPRIYMAPERRGDPVLGVGDRVLAKLRRLRDDTYEGRTVRRVAAGPGKVLGVFRAGTDGGGRLVPTDRRQKAEYNIGRGDTGGAEPGELVLAEVLPSPRPLGLRAVRIVERLGDMADPRSVSLVSIHAHGIPNEFPADALEQAKAAGAAPLGKREDLRAVPLVTIDGEDARDFDDAVWAAPDEDPNNPGGWQVAVAIADVAWYVRPGDALDRSAFERGNSVYFPDRVVPMLPEELSNGWCSLKPAEDRTCMAVLMRFDKTGEKLGHRFLRGMMRSAARLTYTQVQQARDGAPDEATAPLVETVIAPLYGAWAALFEARQRRGVLDLDLPERQVVIGEDGRIARVVPRARFDSHRLIEDFMIAANVAAAETLEKLAQPCMYRVHDKPTPDKLESLRDFLSTLDLSLAKGQVIHPSHFNRVLEQAKDRPEAHLINEVVLRSQAQAVYSPENIGHFGLGLARYAHFTSPIRRYADLLVHRALIAGMSLGDGALSPAEAERFTEIGTHISVTERRAATAERDALDRFTALFLAERVGTAFPARINGVTRFGLFVELGDTGASGLVPVGSLGDDYWIHDETRHALVGRRTNASYSLGDEVEVMLVEANPLTGSLVFHMTSLAAPARGPVRGRGRPRR
ncbi:MAG: ribonuclease R [Alphaproteobacteria bacterium]|nr:ribonuclease R [Alphaproteobacteria bacterium]